MQLIDFQFLQYTMRENEQLHQEIVKAEGKVPFNSGITNAFYVLAFKNWESIYRNLAE